MGIVRAGIRLVTLHDGMEYTAQSIKENWTQLIISITYMARAHEESLRKSQRGKATWEQKRLLATNGSKKMSRIAPAWVELNEDSTEYQLRPKISKKNKLGGWRESYIVKLLKGNRELIG